MTLKGSFNGGGYAPDTQSKDGMRPCCARCKTPFGHSAVAGTCCHGGGVVIIRSSPKPIDRSWRATFNPTPGLMEAAHAEVRRAHSILHKQANLFQMCICGSYGPGRS